MRRVLGLLCVAWLLAGCSTAEIAPVTDLTGANAARPSNGKTLGAAQNGEGGPGTHVVKRGETLYSIALEYGLDYRELAAWNHLADLNHIRVGQVLNVAAPGTRTSPVSAGTQPAAGAVTSPDSQAQAAVTTQALAAPPVIVTTQTPPDTHLIAQPQAIKLPYSSAALAQITQQDGVPVPATPPAVPPTGAPDSAANAGAAPTTALDWMWPANGAVIGKFGDAQGDKGIDISGVRGQPVFAAAAGKVVYSGAGLHGYGKLVIIKHDAIYLTAYAHNAQILVKEGQVVSRGQKIAEMGDSDADRVELHFEVRQMGKPVDPLKYLPEVKK